jgi:hypothetical protein
METCPSYARKCPSCLTEYTNATWVLRKRFVSGDGWQIIFYAAVCIGVLGIGISQLVLYATSDDHAHVLYLAVGASLVGASVLFAIAGWICYRKAKFWRLEHQLLVVAPEPSGESAVPRVVDSTRGVAATTPAASVSEAELV